MEDEKVELKNRLLGIGTEVGGGIATDFATATLLNPLTLAKTGGLSALAYGAINFGQGAYTNYLVQKHLYGNDEINWGEVIASGGMGAIPFMNIGASKGVAKVVGEAGSVQRGLVGGGLTGLVGEQTRVGIDEQRFLNPLEAGMTIGIGGGVGGGLTKLSKLKKTPTKFDPTGATDDLMRQRAGLKMRLLKSIDPENNLQPKGSADITGRSSERFLFGEDVFANLPEANKKALAKLGITDNESKLFISKYNNIGRDSAGAVESVFTTYNDFEKTKSDVFPYFVKEMKNVTQTKTPQLDHVAQLVASLGFFDGQPVKYWPEIAKIVVNEGVFGLGHDPNNLKYLAFDVHTVKSNFWRDNIGDAGEKFFKGRDLSTLPKLKAAAREYAAIIRKSNKLVAQANAQYKLLNKTNISQEELEEFILRLGANPLQSKYNIKQVKAILQQMEEDGFLVKPKTVEAEEAKVIKTEQKTAKAKADKIAKVDKEFQKSVLESETYRKYYASDEGKFKSPLVKGSKDDMLITHAEDIYEEMVVDKNPETKDAIIKKIMKIIKPRYKG